MSKFAWIENGDTVRDVCQGGNPADCYTPQIAALYNTEVPDHIVNGAKLVEGEWVNPTVPEPGPAPEPEPPAPPKLSPVQFKLCFTAPERVAAKALIETDALLADFWSILDDPRLQEVDLGLASTQAGIDYLVSLGVLTVERGAQVKQGIVF